MMDDGVQEDHMDEGHCDRIQVNPFNLRPVILQNMCNWSKNTSKATSDMIYKSKGQSYALDILRRLIEEDLSRDVKSVIDGYLRKYFHPAIKNMRDNNEPISNDYINIICRRMIDRVKEACFPLAAGFESDTPRNDSEDSDKSFKSSTFLRSKRKKFARPSSRCSTPGIRNGAGPRHPAQASCSDTNLSGNSRFVIKSIAERCISNDEVRVLRHPGLFTYDCDAEDIGWLVSSNKLDGDQECRGGIALINLDNLFSLAPQNCRYHVKTIENMFVLSRFMYSLSLNLKLQGFHVSNKMIDKIKQAINEPKHRNNDLRDIGFA